MTQKLTASQRIEALESKILSQDAQIEEMALIIDEVDRKFISLSKRVNASISAVNSNDAVDKIIQGENEKELKKLTDMLIENGVLKDDGEGEVAEASFIVGRHISEEGNEVNPRLQFYVGNLVEIERTKFLGKKVGDMVTTEDSSVSVEITELYSVHNPEVEKNFEDSKENASDSQ